MSFIQTLKARIRPLLLKGNNVHCPVCKRNFITFLPFGNPPRANAWCPKCGSLERVRLLWLYVMESGINRKENVTLLHVAPERILFKKFSRMKNISYSPIDKFEPGYNYPSPTINMDLTDLKFDNNSFDLIICFHVLEHIINDIQAMKEIKRVLKPTGIALLQVPIDYSRATTFEDSAIDSPQERLAHFGQHDHVRIYGRDFEGRIIDSGLSIKERWASSQFTREERFRYGISDERIIYCCVK